MGSIVLQSIRRLPFFTELKYHTLPYFFGYTTVFSFQNNPKYLDPSYKIDLDLWDCLGRVKLTLLQNFEGNDLHVLICTHSREGKTPSCSQINTVFLIL